MKSKINIWKAVKEDVKKVAQGLAEGIKAIQSKKLDVFEFLLQAGVNPQQKNKGRKSPFDEVKRLFECLKDEDFLQNNPSERADIKKMAALFDIK